MLQQLMPLWPHFEAVRAQQRALVLATIVSTEGASYKKTGAMMLIDEALKTHGLLSGGCLEADVAEHAEAVLADGRARTLEYDLSDDSPFGLGAGCDGSIRVLLQRLNPDNDYAPLALLDPRPGHAIPRLLELVHAPIGDLKPGDFRCLDAHARVASAQGSGPHWQSNAAVSRLQFIPPPRVLVAGAGVDAVPMCQLMATQHWHGVLVDHRPGRLQADVWPRDWQHLHCPRAVTLTEHLDVAALDAAVIMSHNIERDAAYLSALQNTPYIGLLGPPTRRDKVLQRAGLDAQALAARLHAPVGLDIGGRMPEQIALSTVAQIQQFLHRREAPCT